MQEKNARQVVDVQRRRRGKRIRVSPRRKAGDERRRDQTRGRVQKNCGEAGRRAMLRASRLRGRWLDKFGKLRSCEEGESEGRTCVGEEGTRTTRHIHGRKEGRKQSLVFLLSNFRTWGPAEDIPGSNQERRAQVVSTRCLRWRCRRGSSTRGNAAKRYLAADWGMRGRYTARAGETGTHPPRPAAACCFVLSCDE